MTTIKQNLDRIEFESGVDATRMCGAHDVAGEKLREAWAVATSHPTISNFRACVEAHDELQALIKKTLDRCAA